jgi:hypothetical protein
VGKTNEKRARLVHLAKGNRRFNKALIEFRPICAPAYAVEESVDEGCTYSLDEITCRGCLLGFMTMRQKEIDKAKQYLKYLGG